MVTTEKSANFNHGRSNAPVRFCPNCGVVVNERVRTSKCSDDKHAASRRAMNRFCVVSVDPLLNESLVGAWRERFAIRRLTWLKASVEDMVEQLNALAPIPTAVTFVHAHVAMDPVLDRLRWDAAFTLACCSPGHQLTQTRVPHRSGVDACVLSSGRRYEVLLNRPLGPTEPLASSGPVSAALART